MIGVTSTLITAARIARAQSVAPPSSTATRSDAADPKESSTETPDTPSSSDSGSTPTRASASPAEERRATRSTRSDPPRDEDNEDDGSSSPDAKPAKTLSTTQGLAAAIQIAYSVPAGELSGDAAFPLANYFGPQIALLGELGTRVTPAIFLGAYGGYAHGGLGSGQPCDAQDCSGYSARLGVAVRYRFFPAPGTQPWIGYAMGYEVAGAFISSASQHTTATLTGFEFAHLSVGLDYSNDKLYAFGPVLDLALGEYNHVKGESSGSAQTERDLGQTAVHVWFSVGVRCTLME